jgi:hypothetical protein
MRRVLIAAATALIAAPALGQDSSEDWDFGVDDRRNLAIAAVTFENFGVAVRCLDGVFGVVLSGLPSGPNLRNIAYRMGDDPEISTEWVGYRNGQTAFAVWPASRAEELARGGRLSLGVRDGDRVRRIAVDLPASSSAVSRVFEACDRTPPSSDPQNAVDGESFAGLRWLSQPDISFPSQTSSEGGLAAIACRSTDTGSLRGCRVESEFPEGGGFGRAATLGTHRSARLQQADGSRTGMDGRRVAFVVRYSLSSEVPLLTPPSRIPRTEPAPARDAGD